MTLRSRIVILRPFDHLVLGQRPRHHLPRRSCASSPRAATTCCSSSATCPGTPRNRDLPDRPTAARALYAACEELQDRFATDVRDADLVIVGSYVPEGVAVGDWVTRDRARLTAFYDIDTPVTLAKLAARR